MNTPPGNRPDNPPADGANPQEPFTQPLPDDQIGAESSGAQPSPQEQISQLQAEMDDLKNRMLRVAADYQNYVRRSQQNMNEARRQQLMEVARALLPVLDHFDRALEIDPNKATVQSLLDGVRIVRDELLKALESFEVRRLDAKVGEPFDPARHEALMRQPCEGVAPNHVSAQLQSGYTLGELTLRPAKVAVSSQE